MILEIHTFCDDKKKVFDSNSHIFPRLKEFGEFVSADKIIFDDGVHEWDESIFIIKNDVCFVIASGSSSGYGVINCQKVELPLKTLSEQKFHVYEV